VTATRRVPPGRAGRLWLEHRLAVARRGTGLLDQKLRILRGERQRFSLMVARTAPAWEKAARDARTWGRRAALLGGERAVRFAAPGEEAEVAVTWAQTMGVLYPVDARLRLPGPDPLAPPEASAAVVEATRAHRAALDAAVRHAVAEAALARVEEEERATRRRVRAIEERWIPWVEDALRQVRLSLAEREHAEGVRLRWAQRRRSEVAPESEVAGDG
jgi:V/A-type H+-transporting ATPase subunit D